MPADAESDIQLEIGHVLFVDLIGYSKLLINEQREQLRRLNEIVRGSAQFGASQAAGKLVYYIDKIGAGVNFRRRMDLNPPKERSSLAPPFFRPLIVGKASGERRVHIYQPIQLTSTIPSIRNSRSRSPLWRRVLLVTVPAGALVALAVALGPVAQAGATPTPTPTPTPQKFKLLRTLPLQSNAWGAVTVNEGRNKIYTSGNPGDIFNSDEEVTVIDGRTFATMDVGYGSEASVDNRTNRYWAATIYQGNVIVRDGTTNDVIRTISLGNCPIATAYDFFKTRMWVGAQCGNLNDPIWAIDANTFAITAGPIGSGGVFSSLIANGANGRLYFTDQDQVSGPQISKRVDPTTFAVTQNAFGTVRAINGLTKKLYAVPDGTNNLQIINGAPDPEVVVANIPLGYSPGSMAINTAFNYLYITNPAGRSIEVRNGSTGQLKTTFHLPTGATPDGAIAVDSIRGRIYVIRNPSSNSGPALLVIEDLVKAFEPYCILSH